MKNFAMALLLAVPGLAFADCSFPEVEMCTKMRLVSSTPFDNWRGLMGILSLNLKEKGCELVFRQEDNGKEWKARTECQEIPSPAYVDIQYACNDTGRWSPDELVFWDPKECETPPKENLARVKAELQKFKPGEKLTYASIAKLRLRPWYRSLEIKNMVLHSYPGVSVEVRGQAPESRNGIWPKNAHFSLEVIDVRQEFISKRECEMWGGTFSSRSSLEVTCKFLDKTEVTTKIPK